MDEERELKAPAEVCLKQLVSSAAEALETRLHSLTGMEPGKPVQFEWPQNPRDGGASVSCGSITFWIHVTATKNLERMFPEGGDVWAKFQKKARTTKVRKARRDGEPVGRSSVVKSEEGFD